MKIYIPDKVQFIIDTFYKNGFEAFIVGGCIRDTLLGVEPRDYDIATSCLPEDTIKLFNKTIPTGLKHGTITVVIDKENFEITTYRTESTYLNNRRPESVNFVKNIKEDLSRRDFTINAFAYNSKEGLLDFFNGQQDLNNKIIRSVGDSNIRFNEDALRMLRAIRFSSQLNFNIENNTFNNIIKNKDLISNISFERIRDELSKILTSNNPEKGLLNLLNSGLLLKILPEFKNVTNDNLKKAFSLVQNTPNLLVVKLSALLYNFDNNLVKALLTRLRFENKIIKEVLILTKEALNIIKNPTSPTVKRFINHISLEYMKDLFSLQNTIILTFQNSNELLNNLDKTKEIYEYILLSKEPLSIKDLNITGKDLIKDLNITPGKKVGEILNSLLELVLDNPSLNTSNILLKIARSKYL
ncbi:MAG: CCA tRNA nucleotidyltransferase [Clostridium sp.]|uniref:CCA tRNA nucleotidyltransferase n=1 Tax=Clostridium sp. TaxID=1506 RepID=UPI003EE7F901